MKDKPNFLIKTTTITIILVLLFGSTNLISVAAAASTSATVNVNTNSVLLTNDSTFGFTLHSAMDEINKFMTRQTEQDLAEDADFQLVRLYDRFLGPNGYNVGGPCKSWNEATKTGTFDWTQTDKIVKEIYSLGAEPLICLSAWRTTKTTVPTGMAIDPNTLLPYPESYAAFAAAWVQHFKSIGLPVRYYEIFNEIQNYIGWSPATANQARIANFVKLFNAAYTKMHQTNSQVMISTDCSLEKHFFNYFINNGVGIDYLDFHKYDAWKYPQFTDAEMFTRAETIYFNTDYNVYSISDARQQLYTKYGKTLQVILSETNFNAVSIGNNGDIGSDPRIQQMAGAIRTALLARMMVLNEVNFMAYHCFTTSYSYESQYPTGGGGFGMINRDNDAPWYPYYVLKMIGANLALNDKILQSSATDSTNLRTLAWINNGKINILIINKSNQDYNVYLQGIGGTATYQKIDESISWTTPKLQTGQLGAYLTLKGYAVALVQSDNIQTTHTIVASANSGGSISPSGSVSVANGADQSFTITPTSGYKITNVLVDGLSVGTVSQYTFNDVAADHTITASFTKEVVYSFEDGFESGNFNAWTGKTGSPVVQTTIKYSGTYAMRAAASSTSSYLTVSESTVQMRAYIYVDSASGSVQLMRFRAGTTAIAVLIRTSSGALQLAYRSGSSLVYVTAATTLSLDRWYCVELRTAIGASGEYSVWLDGAKISAFTKTGIDNNNYGSITHLDVGAVYSSSTVNVYIDNVATSTT